MKQLILASKSKGRSRILQDAGLVFDTEDAGVDEDQVKSALVGTDTTVAEIAIHLARAKALAVSQRREGYVLGADQTLEFAGQCHDKVNSISAARDRLKAYSGKMHRLHSALCIALNGSVVFEMIDSAEMICRDLSDEFISDYLERAGSQVLSSVGCYQIEGLGIQLFDQIDGSHFTIIGLPLLPLLSFLRSESVIP